MGRKLPIGDAVGEILAGDGDTVILLPLFDLDLDLVVLPKIRDLLNGCGGTLESMQPCLTPSLFIATKFLPGYLMSETACSCQPDTTAYKHNYLPAHRICPWPAPSRTHAPYWAGRGNPL